MIKNNAKAVISLLTYNKLDYTRKCLMSLFNSISGDVEVVISDNGSTDGTVEYIKSLSGIYFIDNRENLGFAKAHNQIMRFFPEADVVLLNNDVELPKDWLSELQSFIKERNLGAAGPAIKVFNGLDIGAVLDSNAKGKSIINNGPAPDWITGSCLYITRDTINKIGFLDTRFGFYYEDVDYCLRMKKAELKFECIPEVQIIHHNSVSPNPDKKRELMERSRKLFIHKWDWK